MRESYLSLRLLIYCIQLIVVYFIDDLLPNHRDDGEERDEDEIPPPRSGTPPPDYTPSVISPPVYQDALQDVIVSHATGTRICGLHAKIIWN